MTAQQFFNLAFDWTTAVLGCLMGAAVVVRVTMFLVSAVIDTYHRNFSKTMSAPR